MYVIDLEGNEYALQCTTTWQGELNGNQELSATIESSKVNNLFIDDIAEMWTIVGHDDVEYKIIYCKKQGKGNRLNVQVKAIPLFFDIFSVQNIYEVYNQSFTAINFFDMVFSGSGYTPIVEAGFYAKDWEGLGAGSTRLSMFKDGLNRYGAEFYIDGKNVHIQHQIGRDTQFQYRYKLNASNISQEIDAAALYTYAKGYGDYDSGAEDLESNAGLIREYTSPLANILGKREAPPIKDGRITTTETMDEQLKTLVDESIKISVTADIHDLREQGYTLAQPRLGDRTFLIDERIGLNEEVRVVDMSVTKDWSGKIIDLQLTFGTKSITKRYQSNLKQAVSNIQNILEGKQKLPFTALDAAVIQATNALLSAETELIFQNGIIARDKNDPNYLVLLNSEGLGISDDGGATFGQAITGSGIVADYITAGVLRGIDIIQDDGQGNRIELSSGSFKSYQSNVIVNKLDDQGLSFYQSDTGEETGTLRDAQLTSDSTVKGFSMNTPKDFLSIGFGSVGSTANPILFSRKYNTDAGYTELKATEQGGTAGDLIPGFEARNYTLSEISWSNTMIQSGRDNRQPGGSDERFGIEGWQYRGTGDGANKQMFKYDTNQNGDTYYGCYTDLAYTPKKNYIGTNGSSFLSAGLDIPSNIGTLDTNGVLYVYNWDFTFTTGSAYGDFSFNGAEKIFAVFLQVTGAYSSNMVAGVENISATGFRAYLKNVTGNTGADNRDYTLNLMVVYQPG
ncbi:hypothetical protein Pryu01_03067 [Paraliobacillus ryukyuensis]|uniref:Tail protein (Putative endopeptidase) n=1 Tax=Paraliobacillus ryukyuensis TaxID=200904 RepID=A0A366DSX2_9BACI|nr:phage tail protein [Paraliobacillus ryukyuensis]RBO92298.1 tail protein (putative endopeptidase) [Paraliobacillus ryukyuensis]